MILKIIIVKFKKRAFSSKKSNRMDEQKYINSFYRFIKLIYAGFILCSLVVIFIAIVLILFNSKSKIQLSIFKELLIIIFSLITVYLSQKVYKKSLSNINLKDQLNLRINQFQTAFIFKLGLLEFSLIFIATIFILSRSLLLFPCILILFLIIVLSFPKKDMYLKLIS